MTQAEAGPADEMISGGKDRHVHADLRGDHPNGALVHTVDGVDVGKLLREGGMTVSIWVLTVPTASSE